MSLLGLIAGAESVLQSVNYRGFNVTVECNEGMYEGMVGIKIANYNHIIIATLKTSTLSEFENAVLRSLPFQTAKWIKDAAVKHNARNMTISQLFTRIAKSN